MTARPADGTVLGMAYRPDGLPARSGAFPQRYLNHAHAQCRIRHRDRDRHNAASPERDRRRALSDRRRSQFTSPARSSKVAATAIDTFAIITPFLNPESLRLAASLFASTAAPIKRLIVTRTGHAMRVVLHHVPEPSAITVPSVRLGQFDLAKRRVTVVSTR
jgi:hypothetical protein